MIKQKLNNTNCVRACGVYGLAFNLYFFVFLFFWWFCLKHQKTYCARIVRLWRHFYYCWGRICTQMPHSLQCKQVSTTSLCKQTKIKRSENNRQKKKKTKQIRTYSWCVCVLACLPGWAAVANLCHTHTEKSANKQKVRCTPFRFPDSIQHQQLTDGK